MFILHKSLSVGKLCTKLVHFDLAMCSQIHRSADAYTCNFLAGYTVDADAFHRLHFTEQAVYRTLTFGRYFDLFWKKKCWGFLLDQIVNMFTKHFWIIMVNCANAIN